MINTITVVRYYDDHYAQDAEIMIDSDLRFKQVMNFNIRRLRWLGREKPLGIIGWRILRNDTVLAQYGECT